MAGKILKLKPGDEVWVLEYEDGEPSDVVCLLFMAQCDNVVIGTSQVNDLSFEGILDYHCKETEDNINTDLYVYPVTHCFETREKCEEMFNELTCS